MGEPPSSVYDLQLCRIPTPGQPGCQLKVDNRPWIAVINASGIQVQSAWVQGKERGQFTDSTESNVAVSTT